MTVGINPFLYIGSWAKRYALCPANIKLLSTSEVWATASNVEQIQNERKMSYIEKQSITKGLSSMNTKSILFSKIVNDSEDEFV